MSMEIARDPIGNRPGDGWGFPPENGPGGRTRWAHLEFTRMNIELTIVEKDIEELMGRARVVRVIARKPLASGSGGGGGSLWICQEMSQRFATAGRPGERRQAVNRAV
jgi:hypothetical protein